MATYRIEIQESSATSNFDDDCICCGKDMAHDATRFSRYSKREKCDSSKRSYIDSDLSDLKNDSDTNDESDNLEIEREREKNLREFLMLKDGRKKRQHSCSHPKRQEKMFQESIQTSTRLIKKAEIEYKFSDLIVGSVFTILLWYSLSKHSGDTFFHIITSALVLFVITIFKYRKHIGKEKFWSCFASNFGSLVQAYCTMITICILVCVINSYISQRLISRYSIVLAFFIIIALYIIKNMRKSFKKCNKKIK